MKNENSDPIVILPVTVDKVMEILNSPKDPIWGLMWHLSNEYDSITEVLSNIDSGENPARWLAQQRLVRHKGIQISTIIQAKYN